MLVALVNGEVVTNLRPLMGSWWLNVFLPIALIAVVTLGLHFLLGGRSWREHRTGLWPLFVGKDGRLSTSKVQFMLWTYAVVLALLFLLFFGKDFFENFVGQPGLRPDLLLGKRGLWLCP